ncbi:hypothetical protein BN961_02696 [Afipia felis]|jgi:hypothetical protein|uniref:DUF992 domain-containing protein n=1 Tax=Afipia felis TaxID=1035 RepID=A0A090MPI9_AFIFE|nr:DUF992 domain-containing protein [Afipia felis]CEG09271.1 hypothetical protein BN961_02696 [Afipia felis]
MRLSYLVGAASALLLASFATANAQQGVQVGVLRCHGGPNVGQILTSTTNLDCVFEGRGRRPEGYVATVRRFGVDLGATSQTDFGWRVHAPTVQVGPGDLSGSYAGVGGNAAIGVGGGSNFLVGGSANSFALQPLSLQGQTGLNVSGGIVSLELRPVGYVHRGHAKRHRHHRH